MSRTAPGTTGGVRIGALRGQLLDDQRIATGAVVDAGHRHRVDVAEQRFDEPGDLGGRERRHRDAA